MGGKQILAHSTRRQSYKQPVYVETVFAQSLGHKHAFEDVEIRPEDLSVVLMEFFHIGLYKGLEQQMWDADVQICVRQRVHQGDEGFCRAVVSIQNRLAGVPLSHQLKVKLIPPKHILSLLLSCWY